MSVLTQDAILNCSPKDILHVWKFEEMPGALRNILLYPIDFDQLADAEAATQRGEQNVRITGAKIRLNGTAALIWEMCDGTRTVGEIIDEVAQRFGADPARVREDTLRFFARLEPYNVLDLDWSPL